MPRFVQSGDERTGLMLLDAIIVSPPFADSIGSGEAARKILIDNYKTRDTQNTSQKAIDRLETRFAADYGWTVGQIGLLKSGTLDMTGASHSVGECRVSDWHNCYDGSWKGLIVDEAFAHP